MTNKSERLKLEAVLNQIYENNNIYNGSFRVFSFCNVNFVFLNGVYIYSRQNESIIIGLDETMMNITTGRGFIEIRYSDINDFLINLKEA